MYDAVVAAQTNATLKQTISNAWNNENVYAFQTMFSVHHPMQKRSTDSSFNPHSLILTIQIAPPSPLHFNAIGKKMMCQNAPKTLTSIDTTEKYTDNRWNFHHPLFSIRSATTIQLLSLVVCLLSERKPKRKINLLAMQRIQIEIVCCVHLILRIWQTKYLIVFHIDAASSTNKFVSVKEIAADAECIKFQCIAKNVFAEIIIYNLNGIKANTCVTLCNVVFTRWEENEIRNWWKFKRI